MKQEKETKAGKSLWHYLFAAIAAFGGVKLLGRIWGYLAYLIFREQTHITHVESASIGIIGGADGPTAVFVTVPTWISWLYPAVLLLLGIGGLLYLRRKNRS